MSERKQASVNSRARVAGALLDCQQLNLHDVRHANAGHDPQSQGPHQRRGRPQVLLEGVDGEQGEFSAGGVVVAVAGQEQVHHFLHFHLISERVQRTIRRGGGGGQVSAARSVAEKGQCAGKEQQQQQLGKRRRHEGGGRGIRKGYISTSSLSSLRTCLQTTHFTTSGKNSWQGVPLEIMAKSHFIPFAFSCSLGLFRYCRTRDGFIVSCCYSGGR